MADQIGSAGVPLSPASAHAGASTPLVSVILPTYDRLPLLRQAVASVIAQTFGDWELIVVDDGSADGTRDWLASLGDPRVRPLLLAHTGVPPRARQAALDAARGDWVAFLDSDDLWLPAKLELQLRQLADHSSCGWSCTGVQLVDAAGTPIPSRPPVPWVPHSGWVLDKLLTFEASASIQTILARRSLVRDVGGLDDAFSLRDDYDLALRLAARSELWATVETLTLVRDHPARSTTLTREAELCRQNAAVFAKAARAAASPRIRAVCARQRAAQLIAMGVAFARERRRADALVAAARAVAIAPFAFRSWRGAIAVVARTVGLRR